MPAGAVDENRPVRVLFPDAVSDVPEEAGVVAGLLLLNVPNDFFASDVSDLVLFVPDGLAAENPRLKPDPDRLELEETELELLANAPEVQSIKASIQTAHFDFMCVPFLFGNASITSGIGSARIARNVVC